MNIPQSGPNRYKISIVLVYLEAALPVGFVWADGLLTVASTQVNFVLPLPLCWFQFRSLALQRIGILGVISKQPLQDCISW